MSRDRVKIGSTRQQLKKPFPIARFIDPAFASQGRMGCNHHKPIFVHISQFLLKPSELIATNRRLVSTATAHIARVRLTMPFVLNIIEHNKVRICVFKRVVRGAEESFECFQRALIAFRFEVQLMIPRHVVPGNPYLSDKRVISREHREIIEQDVSHGHPKDRFCSDQLTDQIIPNVIEFSICLRLGIGHQNRLE